jgi:hypothetical protein
MDPLSKYLTDQIDLIEESLTAQELSEYAATREKLLESVEGLCGNNTSSFFITYHSLRDLFFKHKGHSEGLEIERALLEESLDDALTRLLLAEVPRMVSRALQLEPMSIDQRPQPDANSYLREATRCYLYGLFNASVALSRSALEYALSRKTPIELQGAPGEDTLLRRIATARSSILKSVPELCDRADAVRRSANRIIHGKACKGPEAMRVLSDTRSIIIYLYSKKSPK